MVTFSHHAVNYGAKALLIHYIFGATTLPFWCQIVTMKSGLVRKRDTFWCETGIFHFSVLGAKTLIFGANSRPLLNKFVDGELFVFHLIFDKSHLHLFSLSLYLLNLVYQMFLLPR